MADKQKRRSWGKTRQNKDTITIVNQTDIENVVRECKELELARKSAQVERKEAEHILEAQHPELMHTERLVTALTELKVPIPVYEDGKPSRERLVYLFRKHVTPRPQRSWWRRGSRKRRRGGQRGGDWAWDQQEPCAMEVEDQRHEDNWVMDSGDEEPSPRKRKLEGATNSLPAKRQPESIVTPLSLKHSKEPSVSFTTKSIKIKRSTISSSSELCTASSPVNGKSRPVVPAPLVHNSSEKGTIQKISWP